MEIIEMKRKIQNARIPLMNEFLCLLFRFYGLATVYRLQLDLIGISSRRNLSFFLPGLRQASTSHPGAGFSHT